MECLLPIRFCSILLNNSKQLVMAPSKYIKKYSKKFPSELNS